MGYNLHILHLVLSVEVMHFEFHFSVLSIHVKQFAFHTFIAACWCDAVCIWHF